MRFKIKIALAAAGIIACAIGASFCVALAQNMPSPTAVNISSLSGQAQVLANAASATSSTVYTSSAIGFAKRVTLCMSASATETFTVTESVNALFYQATIAGTTTTANLTTSGAGTICELITPSTFVKVATSATATVSIELTAAY
jgi:hypothetical protein